MVQITTDLVRRLVEEQLPQWSTLPVRPVAVQGNDNRTFRLGDELAVRLPSAVGYVAGVAKEDAVLPHLAPWVSTRLPVPAATGRPGCGYPWPWSVRPWIDGVSPEDDQRLDRRRFAHDVGAFLRELRAVPVLPGFAAGEHSFHRGGHPEVYGEDVERSLARLGDRVDVAACRDVWADALGSRWVGEPVWFHGDVAAGNLLVRDGRLVAVIDLGTCGTGDPACDLVLAWTFLRGEERTVLAQAADLDDGTWARARGWALWKALVTLAADHRSPQHDVQEAALHELLGDG